MRRLTDENMNSLIDRMIKLTESKTEIEQEVYYPYLVKNATRSIDVRIHPADLQKIRRRYMEVMRKDSRFLIMKMDGMITIHRLPPPSHTARETCLLDKGDECPPCKTQTKPPELGGGTLRNSAENKLCEVKTLSESAGNYISKLFKTYLDYINSMHIVLKHKKENKLLVLNWETRFNSKSRQIQKVDKYETAWKKATMQYKNAVFITLTTDPKKFESLSMANLHISEAWNTFMAWVRKKIGFRPKYIRVLEFTKSGLAHIHAVLFGISRLDDVKKISKEWEKIGQGKIVYIYKLINQGGRWIWQKARPRKTKKQVRSYLKKYLMKAMSQKAEYQIALYWALNMRFLTLSRTLTKPSVHFTVHEWEFWKIIPTLLIFDSIPFYYKIANWDIPDG